MVKIYHSNKEFKAGNAEMEKKGFKVKSVSQQKDSYKAKKGCCLALIFLPLALLARGDTRIVVVYEKK